MATPKRASALEKKIAAELTNRLLGSWGAYQSVMRRRRFHSIFNNPKSVEACQNEANRILDDYFEALDQATDFHLRNEPK